MPKLKIRSDRLVRIVENFSESSILVLGDIILDHYIWGAVNRICPEAPVPVVEVSHDSYMLGGAANVVTNVKVLGGKVALCGLVGKDSEGGEIQKMLRLQQISVDGVCADAGRPTTRKTRVVAGHQQVVRFDRESKTVLSPKVFKRMEQYLRSTWNYFDAVIISDYAKGMISQELMEVIRQLQQRSPKLVCVDPKEKNIERFKGTTLITPNKKEASVISGKEISTESDLQVAGQEILHRLNCENLVITLGAEGMALFQREGEYLKIPTFAKEVFDVSGAGDTVISTLTLALSGKATLEEAAILANYAAGVVVGKIGTATVTAEELKDYVRIEKKRVMELKHPPVVKINELSTRTPSC